MFDSYERNVEGLLNPDTMLDSAIWLVENPGQIQDQTYYMKSCDILYYASMENKAALQYIAEQLQNDPAFKVQLLAQVFKETVDKDIKQAAFEAIDNILQKLNQIKGTSTDIAAQIYSHLESVGDATIMEKAKKLL